MQPAACLRSPSTAQAGRGFQQSCHSFIALTATRKASYRECRSRRSLVVRAVRPEPRKENEERLKGIFEFVIDNPSSKSAIQLDANPAADGNLGQLIEATRDKGKDHGEYYLVGEFQYFIRETGSKGDARPGFLSMPKDPVVLLHGAPTQSWSFRSVMLQLAEKGHRCVAPDWLGFGFSEKPQAGYYFAYTEAAYHQELERFLEARELSMPFVLVVQGFFMASYALTWALKNPGRLRGLAILNTPLSPSSSLPGDLSSLRIPFVGEFACQNAVLSERFIEKGSPYKLEDEDADVYRLPYLDSGEPGFALLEVARKYDGKDVLGRIQKGFAEESWSIPTTVLWGPDDPYLSITEAEAFACANAANVELRKVDGAGHMPQEDWSEKVTDGLLSLFSRIK